jgi:3-isopropylmalate/(R)-2-methylmalate dehydratase small subunit
MPEILSLDGVAAPLPINNLDTDQIMPKQFLRGIDKAGLAQGVLYDMRFDAAGRPQADFVLNRPAYAGASILVTGANFGCGSSREHAVWGLLQLGIRAVIAASYGEIFYSNAMNNQLLPVILPAAQVEALLAAISGSDGARVHIDLESLRVEWPGGSAPFTLSERHRGMFMQGLDMIGASVQMLDQVRAFEQQHWAGAPWLKDVAGGAQARRDDLSVAQGAGR